MPLCGKSMNGKGKDKEWLKTYLEVQKYSGIFLFVLCAAPKIEGEISKKGASSQTHAFFGEWVT